MRMNLMTVAALLAAFVAYAQTAVGEDLTTGAKVYGSVHLGPGERMIAGTERGVPLVSTGAKDAVTAPVSIVGQIQDETANFGPAGVVTGTVRGAIKAAGQALKGGARMAIGILDVLTSPMGRID